MIMPDDKLKIQFVWGVALCLMGLAVFYRIPQVMPKIAQIEFFSSMMLFIRFCFYLIGIMLIGGGARKLYVSYQQWAKLKSP